MPPATAFSYVREHYGVPAELGRIVTINGKPGVIAEDRGHHLGVSFDEDKSGLVRSVHPTWEAQYGGLGKVRPMTPAQARYRRFVRYRDGFSNFLAFCRWDALPSHSWNAKP